MLVPDGKPYTLLEREAGVGGGGGLELGPLRQFSTNERIYS